MEKVFKTKEGLRVLFVPVPSATSVTIFKSYAVGSRNEPPALAGGAHFIEHLMFKGTVKRSSPKAITKELDKVGAHYNAFTGKDMTAYFIKITPDKFELACDIVSDMTYNSTFPIDEVQREKGVIIEEMKMYEDDPRSYIDDLYEQLVYKGNTLGGDTIGSRETVNAATRDTLIKFRDSFYHDDNSVIIVSGAIPKNAKTLINKYFSGHPTAKHKPVKCEKFVFKPSGVKILSNVKKVEQAQFMFGFTTTGFTHKDSYVYSLISAILGGGMSSVLFDEIREKLGLCYFIRMYASQYQEVGQLVIRAGLNQDKIDEALVRIIEILKDFKAGRFSDDDLKHAKDFIYGNMMLELEDSATRGETYMKKFTLMGEIVSPEEKLKIIKSVTRNDILRVANMIFVKERCNLALIASKDFSKEAKKIINTHL